MKKNKIIIYAKNTIISITCILIFCVLSIYIYLGFGFIRSWAYLSYNSAKVIYMEWGTDSDGDVFSTARFRTKSKPYIIKLRADNIDMDKSPQCVEHINFETLVYVNFSNPKTVSTSSINKNSLFPVSQYGGGISLKQSSYGADIVSSTIGCDLDLFDQINIIDSVLLTIPEYPNYNLITDSKGYKWYYSRTNYFNADFVLKTIIHDTAFIQFLSEK